MHISYHKMVEVDIDLAQGGKNQGTYYTKMKDVVLSDGYIREAIRDYIYFLGLRKVGTTFLVASIFLHAAPSTFTSNLV